MILGCNQEHMNQLQANKEEMVFVGHERMAQEVAGQFRKICRETAKELGIPLRAIVETEILKTEPHSSGQVEHMDAMGGVWNFFATLVPSKGTIVKQQYYQDFPKNIGPKSTIPRDWSSLPNILINWEVGDLLLLRSNAIHGAPPNGATRRYVLFGSEESLYPSEYSDSLVVTEEEFFLEKGKNTHTHS